METTVPTKEEMVDLYIRKQNGDESAHEEMMSRNKGLMYSYIHRHLKDKNNFDLWEQMGMIALAAAVEKFDPSRGRFSTLATIMFRQVISRETGNTNNTIRIPLGRQTLMRKVWKVRDRLEQENHRLPTSVEISEELMISAKKVEALLRTAHASESLDQEIGFDTTTTKHEVMHNVNHMTAAEEVSVIDEGLYTARQIYLLRDFLVPRFLERDIDMFFAKAALFTPNGGASNDEIGERYDLTGERVRQITKKVFDKIQPFMPEFDSEKKMRQATVKVALTIELQGARGRVDPLLRRLFPDR